MVIEQSHLTDSIVMVFWAKVMLCLKLVPRNCCIFICHFFQILGSCYIGTKVTRKFHMMAFFSHPVNKILTPILFMQNFSPLPFEQFEPTELGASLLELRPYRSLPETHWE